MRNNTNVWQVMKALYSEGNGVPDEAISADRSHDATTPRRLLRLFERTHTVRSIAGNSV